MMPFGIQYSNDDGSTWSTPLVITAWNIRITEVQDPDNANTTVTGKRYPRKFTYLYAVIVPNLDHFDPSHPTHGATADASWAELEAICAGLLIRIYNNNTTVYPNWDGHTEFNSASNTVYMLLESNAPIFRDMDVHGSSGRKRRSMTIELQSQNAVA